MTLDFSQNEMNVVFDITDEKRVVFTDFSRNTQEWPNKNDIRWNPIVEVHITGENQNDHHGAKHTGTWGSTNLVYDTHKYYVNKYGNKLEFYLCSDKINVVVHYQFYKDISAVRAWSVVTNISDKTIGLEYVSSFSYAGLENHSPYVYIPHNTWCREVDWKAYTLSELGFDRTFKFSMKRVAVSNTGTWSSKEFLPMGVFSDTQNTLMWQIENNGSWQWEISDIADMLYLKLSGPTEQENMWYKELKQGETFESVKVCVALGVNFDHALEQMTKYRRFIFQNNHVNSSLPVVFNDAMGCIALNPTTERLLPVIDKAAEIGAECFCIDAGWYAEGHWWDSVGEWQPREWRFPAGIKEVIDYIKSKNMIPGMWLEIEVMGILCPILDCFDDECFFVRHGKRIIDHGRYQLDFRNKKVREFVSSVVDRLVTEYGVGYIKMDYNIEGGVGTENNADSFGDGLLQYSRAYVEWIREIKEKYPQLIIENCASGGMRMDYGVLSECHLQSVSDQTNYRHTAVISANAATAVLPEQSAIWSYPSPKGDANEVSFNIVNSILSHLYLSGDIMNLTPEKLEEMKQGVAVYKTLRSKITEFIPFYPLGLNGYHKGFACVGYRAESVRYLAVWRLDAGEKQIFIPLKGATIANILYPVESKCKISIEADGLNVSLPDEYSAVILEVGDDREV
ncbi:MAG: alpha-galactosidase [Lachnospiraceae bacterium]|nr:alpha-galactosidase [Lachnospiraceae bacterium]